MKRILALILSIITLCQLASCRRDEGAEHGDVVAVPTAEIVDIERPKNEDVILNELMADNESFVMGCFDDWAELYNAEDKEVKLDAWSLAKDEPGSPAFPLTGLTIPAKGYLVVRMDEGSPFRLSKDGGTLMLLKSGVMLDSVAFGASTGSESWTHGGIAETPTPGFENSPEGYEEYLASRTRPEVIINEVMSSNDKIPAPDGSFCDMVEIFNSSAEPVSLNGWTLSDKRSELDRYAFPDVTLEPGGYFVVCCTGDSGYGHAPFKISSSGEKLYLCREGEIVDHMVVPGDIRRNESYGVSGSGYAYFDTPSFGAANNPGYEASLLPPEANYPTGAYTEALSIELTGSGEIHYTLDGTAPTANSKVYSGPITIRHMAALRAVCIDGDRESDQVSYFYVVNVEHAFPILNISIRNEYLTGDKGVLNHTDPEYEHEAFVSMMDNGELIFSAPCGFKLHGNDSKKGEKQNFQLRFREKYGLSKLECKLFENRDIEKFNSLILKGGSEDYVFCNFRDELCTSLVDGVTELSVQAYRPVILYLNDEYRGIYFIRERFDAEYCAQRLGVSDESVNMVKDYGEAVVTGSGKGFSDLVKYCKNHDLREEEAYKYVMARIDANSLMDWYICRSYLGDTDLANVRMYNSDESDGRWRWCFYDLDWAMWNDTADPIGKTARNDGNHVIILALLKNPTFRDKFLKRYALLMSSILNEQAITAKIDRFAKLLEPEIAADREKYGYTVDQWRYNVNKLKSYVKDGKREKTVLKGIQNYFNLSDAQMKEYFGKVG